jgi:hypothetical protein
MLVPDRIVSTSPHLYRRWVILTLFLVNVINQVGFTVAFFRRCWR